MTVSDRYETIAMSTPPKFGDATAEQLAIEVGKVRLKIPVDATVAFGIAALDRALNFVPSA